MRFHLSRIHTLITRWLHDFLVDFSVDDRRIFLVVIQVMEAHGVRDFHRRYLAGHPRSEFKAKRSIWAWTVAGPSIETLTIIGTEDLALCNMSLVHNSTWYRPLLLGCKVWHCMQTWPRSSAFTILGDSFHLLLDICRRYLAILLVYFEFRLKLKSIQSDRSQSFVQRAKCLRQRNFTRDREFNKELTFDSISHDSGWKIILMERLKIAIFLGLNESTWRACVRI